jgi:hypothetical protein
MKKSVYVNAIDKRIQPVVKKYFSGVKINQRPLHAHTDTHTHTHTHTHTI